MSKDYRAGFVGRIEKVLVEEEEVIDGTKYYVGHNERYLKLAVEAADALTDPVNRIIDVKVIRLLTDDILLCGMI